MGLIHNLGFINTINLLFMKPRITLFTLRLIAGLFFTIDFLAVRAQVVPIKTHDYPVPSTGVVKYVAPEPTGKTTNAGTFSSPWTLTKALTDAPAGSVIILRGGTYRQVDNVKIANQVTLQPYLAENAWIKGSQQLASTSTAWIETTNGAGGTVWRYDGWNYAFPSQADPRDIDPLYPLADNRDMLFINNTSLKQVATLDEVAAGKFYVNYAANQIYVGTNPIGQVVESTRYTTPFLYKDPDTGKEIASPNGLIIKGLGFAHFADGVLIKSLGLQLMDNTFAWNGWVGVRGQAENALIKGNIVAYNGRNGINFKTFTNSVLEGNQVYDNNIENYDNSWAAAGIKIITTKNMIVRNNIIERTRNKSTGLWLDVSCINVKVINNTFRENGGFGVFAEISNKPIIAGNLFENNGNYAITLSDTDESEIWNNTIIGKGFFIKDTDRKASEAGDRREFDPFIGYIQANAAECDWITKNNIIKNNIISTTDETWLENKSTTPALQVEATAHNGYYRGASTNTDPIIKWGASTYTTLQNFKDAVSGYEVNSKAFYNQVSHPYFISSTNYRLKVGSEAIDAGAALPANVADALGWPAGVAVDMGAFQNQAVMATADTYGAKATPTTPYGTSEDIQVKLAEPGSSKEAFLKFTISNIPGPIAHARIRLYGKLVASGDAFPVQVFACSTTGWSEFLTWNTKPAATGPVLSSAIISSTTSQWFDFDVTPYLKAQQADDATVVSFVLKAGSTSSVHALFNSSEATSNQPELVID